MRSMLTEELRNGVESAKHDEDFIRVTLRLTPDEFAQLKTVVKMAEDIDQLEKMRRL